MSKLEEVSLPFRNKLIASNDYDNNDQYVVSHADALSTGDEEGKGELNGKIGGLTDIKSRDAAIVKNKYNKNKEYNNSTA